MMTARCSQYWSFLVLTSGFGFCTGMWVASETPLIIKTLRSVLVLLIMLLMVVLVMLLMKMAILKKVNLKKIILKPQLLPTHTSLWTSHSRWCLGCSLGGCHTNSRRILSSP